MEQDDKNENSIKSDSSTSLYSYTMKEMGPREREFLDLLMSIEQSGSSAQHVFNFLHEWV